MGRIIKVGDGFLKTTLTNAITNAQYGDTILIDNINFNKETMSFFEIPKGMDIKITSIDSEKKSLSGFKFLIKGNLSVSNVTLNSEEKHVVFDIDQGSLELDNISFNKMFSKFHKTAISNNGGNLLIKNSITLCPYSTNAVSYTHLTLPTKA